MRYDKSTKAGLQSMTNHELHILANNRHYKASDQNLNFVFSVAKDQQWYWKNYYFVVPYLLYYTTEIVDAILFPYLPGEDYLLLQTQRALQRKIALFFWSESVASQGKRNGNRILSLIKKALECTCPKCHHSTKIDLADLQLFMDSGLMICLQCYNPILDAPTMKKIAELLPIL